MAVFKCKMCGGDLNITDLEQKVAKCPYCGTTQTTPTLDDDRKVSLFSRADKLRRASDFDKAAGVYETIVAEFPEEAEAYWGLCLCKYGIEYVDDPATGAKVPTCHRAAYDSIFDDQNFELALENSDEQIVKLYRAEAKVIDGLQRSILEIAQKEAPYDVFICYKETDPEGNRTEDSVLAQDIYDALKNKGYRVFFSRISLEDKLGQAYEPYIFSALNSATVMVAVGTSYEYFNAVWVKNEWSRFVKLMQKDKTKILIPCYKNIDAYDMPKEFRNLQGQDMSKIGCIQDLVHGIEKFVSPGNSAAGAMLAASGGSLATVSSLLKRADICLADGDWANADKKCEEVLDADPENKDAYLKKMLAEVRASNMEALGNSSEFYYKKSHLKSEQAYRFADDATKAELEKYYELSHEKFNEKTYGEAVALMDKHNTESYSSAADLFGEIKTYRDSPRMKKLCGEHIEAINCAAKVEEGSLELSQLQEDARKCASQLRSAKGVFIFNSHGVLMIVAAILLGVYTVMNTIYLNNGGNWYSSGNQPVLVVGLIAGLAYVIITFIGLFRGLEFIDSNVFRAVLTILLLTFTATIAFYISGIIHMIIHLVRRRKDIKYARGLSEEANYRVSESQKSLGELQNRLNETNKRIAELEAAHYGERPQPAAV